ncbi:hypothetical protein ACW0JT_20545 [Arthrobacter sp. SA17]
MSNDHAYAERRRDRKLHTRARARSRVIHFLFFLLPRLVFWYTVKIIATAMLQLTRLTFTSAIRSQAKETPSLKPSPAPDDRAEQFRAEKRRQRNSAMDDWDHEWAQLSVTRPEERVERTELTPQQQPAQGAPSSDQASNGLNDQADPARRTLQLRFHTDVIKLHAARMTQTQETARIQEQIESQPTPDASTEERAVIQHVPAATDTTPLDPEQLLANDPRTMWAWAEYREGCPFLSVTAEDARQVLSAIPPGDHVEIFAAVTITVDYPRRSKNALPGKPDSPRERSTAGYCRPQGLSRRQYRHPAPITTAQ